MRSFRYMLLLSAAALPLWAGAARATPVETAVAETMVSKLSSLGYTGSETIVGSTLSEMGTAGLPAVVTADAPFLGTGAAVATGPWLPVVALAAAAGATAYNVCLNTGCGLQWAMSPDAGDASSITPLVQSTATGDTTQIQAGQTIYQLGFNNSQGQTQYYQEFGANVQQLVPFAQSRAVADFKTLCQTAACGFCDTVVSGGALTNGSNEISFSLQGYQSNADGSYTLQTCNMTYYTTTLQAPYSCENTGPVSGFTSGACQNPSGTGQGAPQTPAQAVSSIPSNQLATPIDPNLLANLVNQLWQQAAAAPGYTGVPYPANNPVSSTDVTNANPTTPTLSDGQGSIPASGPTVFYVPNVTSNAPTTTGTGTGTTTTTGSGTGTGTTTNNTTNNITNNTTVDLGPDPGIGPPALTPPVIGDILDPIFQSPFVNTFSKWTVPAHTGACPTDTLNIWGYTFQLNQHCAFFENYRGTIGAFCILAGTILSLLIVMGA